MILSVTLNPSADRSLFFEKLELSDTNRVLRAETDAGICKRPQVLELLDKIIIDKS